MTILPNQKHIAQMPNGEPCRYELGYKRTSVLQWWRKYDCDLLRKNLLSKKEFLPKLDAYSPRGTTKGVFADFDELSPEFQSFDAIAAALKAHLGSRAVVFRSPSGKAKALIPIELNHARPMSSEIAIATLKAVLPENLHFFDKRPSALQTAFLHPGNVDVISSELPHCQITPAVVEDTGGGEEIAFPLVISRNFPPTPHVFRRYEGPLDDYPSLETFIYCARTSKQRHIREELIRRLVCNAGLLDSFALPQKKLAKEIGCDQKSISNALTALQYCRYPLLDCTHLRYKFGNRGREAKKYRACFELKVAIIELRVKGRTLTPLPTNIENGKWDETLRLASLHFPGQPQKYLAWVKTLPGVDEKKRFPKAYRIARRFLSMPENRAEQPSLTGQDIRRASQSPSDIEMVMTAAREYRVIMAKNARRIADASSSPEEAQMNWDSYCSKNTSNICLPMLHTALNWYSLYCAQEAA